MWIGEIQWMRRNGFDVARGPILKPLDTIECRDAVLVPDGGEPHWPDANVVIGNPPFLGGKLMRNVLGHVYVDRLFDIYHGRVPAESDLVCYWFDKAWRLVADGRVQRAGLVATNSIRGGANRAVLNDIVQHGIIFEAWDDEPWVIEGAAVRVSIVCFGLPEDNLRIALDGVKARRIHADLTAGEIDLTQVARLAENSEVSFMGVTKSGRFDVQAELARTWLQLPTNPNGQRNSDVLKRSVNGSGITDRPNERWLIDFNACESEAGAALYEAPYEYAVEHIRPARLKSRTEKNRKFWWRYERPRPAMFSVLRICRRYIGTSMVSKHRFFVWLPVTVIPENLIIVIARDDDVTFGILHSWFHERWALRRGTWLGKGNDPRYTPTTTFETFPFPEGLTPDIAASAYADDPRAVAIAEAARRLDELRQAWLNPPDLVRREPEVAPGYPDRILPIDEKAAAILKKRTLTNLYNERPTWLDNAHRDLDAAVAAAYGWPAGISDDDALTRLATLNAARQPGG